MSAVESLGTAWVRVCSASCAMWWASVRLVFGVDVEFGVGVQPVPDPAHLDAAHAFHAGLGGQRRFGGVDESGSTPSMSRRNTSRTAVRRTARIATVMSSPTMGSASGKPSATPPAPKSTASEVNPSVRACSPSATSAAEPMRRPTRMR